MEKEIPVEIIVATDAPVKSIDYVEVDGDDPKYIDVTGLKFNPNDGPYSGIQDLIHPIYGKILTTAQGVAPAGLGGKCFWLRTGSDNVLSWELVKHANYFVLIPTIKSEEVEEL